MEEEGVGTGWAGEGRAGERVVRVAAERLAGWGRRFEERHGAAVVATGPTEVVLTAPDGAVAVVEVPFPPLPDTSPVGPAGIEALADHATRDRTLGAVLVRRGGYAVGWFEGRRLAGSKVGSAYVQGRTKAGGWSQQRYARRRANQAGQAYGEAAGIVSALLLPRVAELDAVAGGGDAVGVQAVLADARLAPVRALLLPRVLPTPDPRLRVLEAFGDQLREVRVRVNPLA